MKAKIVKENYLPGKIEEEWRGDFEGDTPADQGERAARRDNAPKPEVTYTLSEVKDLMSTLIANVIEDFDDHSRGPEFAAQDAEEYVEKFFSGNES